MAGSLNKVTLIGNLGKDPETHTSQSGKISTKFSLATTESWKDKQTGEWKNKTEWHRVVIWNEGLAKMASNALHKGSKVYVEGQLQTRKWTDNSGQEKYSTEIVLPTFGGVVVILDAKQKDANETPQNPSTPADLDDDIPF
ncbi:MAG TPA: single-stranded DNA-binding protein [Eubacteriales bacterium]|nr:single-stranded DNA-binding protein [Eubacteriales bacterium]